MNMMFTGLTPISLPARAEKTSVAFVHQNRLSPLRGTQANILEKWRHKACRGTLNVYLELFLAKVIYSAPVRRSLVVSLLNIDPRREERIEGVAPYIEGVVGMARHRSSGGASFQVHLHTRVSRLRERMVLCFARVRS